MHKLLLSLFAASLLIATPWTAAASNCAGHEAEKTAEAKHDCSGDCASKCGVAKKGYCPKMAAAEGKQVKTADVTLTGKVLCEHCNLKRADHCNSVFQAKGEKEYIELCPHGDIDGVKTASEHGKNELEVKGTLHTHEDGTKVLEISSWKKVDQAQG